jgi:hypothetical protein
VLATMLGCVVGLFHLNAWFLLVIVE